MFGMTAKSHLSPKNVEQKDGESDSVSTDGESKRVGGRHRRKLSKDEMESSLRAITERDGLDARKLDQMRRFAKLNLEMDRRALDDLANLLRSKLILTVHRRLVHAYHDCFRGSEAVAWLVTHSVCTDPDDAKNLMRHLLYRRIILRVDHTKPMFNSVIQSMAPGLAQWRRKKQLQWYQDGAKQYNMAALYTFNVSAFAQYRLVVRVVSARGLRYTRHNHLTGRWENKRIAPLASVSLGGATANTSVDEKTSEPHWDETMLFDFDKSLNRHEEVIIKVYDFREVGESFTLGVCCVSTAEILSQCGIDPDVPPPTSTYDAPGWLAWHPLLPPATMAEPDEVRGGSVQVQFQILTNVAESADETVHDECRPASRDAAEAGSTGVTDEELAISNRSRGAPLPKTVLKYQHLDRRPSGEIALKRPQSPSEDASRRNGDKAAANGKPENQQHYDRWSLHVTSIELHGISDIPPGAVVWVEVTARTPKRSAFLTTLRNRATRDRRKPVDDTGVIARKRSSAFLWPKDGRKLVRCGAVTLMVPDDVLRYVTVEFRVIRKKDIANNMVGKGRLVLNQVRKADEDEETDSEDGDGELTDVEEAGEAAPDLPPSSGGATARPAAAQEGGAQASDAPGSAGTPKSESGPLLAADTMHSLLEESAVPEVDDLPFQRAVVSSHQDARIVVLRKQAAFKRNIKIKSGQMLFFAKLKPMVADEFDDSDLVSLSEAHEEQQVDIEDALQRVVGSPGEIPAPIAVPEPFGNVYVDATINASVQRLAMLLLGTDSKFASGFAKERKNTEVKVGPWKLPDAYKERSNSDSAEELDDEDDAAEEVAEDAEVANSEEASSDGALAKSATSASAAQDQQAGPDALESVLRVRSAEQPASERVMDPRLVKSTQASSVLAPDAEDQAKETRSRSRGSSFSSAVSEADAAPEAEPGHPSRVLTFMLPASALTKAAECTETQEILQIEPGGFVYTSTSETPTVPYGDRFFTRSQFVITYLSANESRLRISGEAVWKEKGPPGFPIKGLILNGVKTGHSEAYSALVTLLREWVTPRRVAKSKPAKKKKTSRDGEDDDAAAAASAGRLGRWLRIILALVFVCITICALLLAAVHFHLVDRARVQSTLDEVSASLTRAFERWSPVASPFAAAQDSVQ